MDLFLHLFLVHFAFFAKWTKSERTYPLGPQLFSFFLFFSFFVKGWVFKPCKFLWCVPTRAVKNGGIKTKCPVLRRVVHKVRRTSFFFIYTKILFINISLLFRGAFNFDGRIIVFSFVHRNSCLKKWRFSRWEKSYRLMYKEYFYET